MNRDNLPKTTVEYLLQALVPYTAANIKLVFRPSQFFYDLEKISQRKQRVLKTAFYRAQRSGLVEIDEEGIPRLTEKGKRKVKRFEAKYLGSNARLMVAFDIPEVDSWKRQHLRRLLRELDFTQIQRSVWVSEFDHSELIKAEREQYDLQDEIHIYEAVRI